MELTDISGIPTGIVNNHNEVLYYWVNSGLRDATLFKVDAHADMVDYCLYDKYDKNLDYNNFDIADFNCPAIYHGIINEIYWHNPHSLERNLQNMRFVETKLRIKKVDVDVKKSLSPNWKDCGPLYRWKLEEKEKERIFCGKGAVIKPEEMKIAFPFIADFDLDGFCCHQINSINNHPKPSYDGVANFKQRIDESISLLEKLPKLIISRDKEKLPKPNLITIARSQGYKQNDNYVPLEKVDEVQEKLIKRLKEIY